MLSLAGLIGRRPDIALPVLLERPTPLPGLCDLKRPVEGRTGALDRSTVLGLRRVPLRKIASSGHASRIKRLRRRTGRRTRIAVILRHGEGLQLFGFDVLYVDAGALCGMHDRCLQFYGGGHVAIRGRCSDPVLLSYLQRAFSNHTIRARVWAVPARRATLCLVGGLLAPRATARSRSCCRSLLTGRLPGSTYRSPIAASALSTEPKNVITKRRSLYIFISKVFL